MSEWSQAVSGFKSSPSESVTLSGARGLQEEEPLLFEQDAPGRCGVDLPDPELLSKGRKHADHLGAARRTGPIGLPGLSEPQIVRHYTRLSQKNYAIDSGLYPLGSCTMKHNPRLNEKMARLPGFADLHPLQPVSTVQGALELIDTLAHWLKILTGMPAVAMSPGAGAHGELCGLMAIRAALEARGETRHRVLVPESAHGTNPATAAACGFEVESIHVDDFTPPLGKGLWVDSSSFFGYRIGPIEIAPGHKRWELNRRARVIQRAANAISPWLVAGGVLAVARRVD